MYLCVPEPLRYVFRFRPNRTRIQIPQEGTAVPARRTYTTRWTLTTARTLHEWDGHATCEDLDFVKYEIHWLIAPKVNNSVHLACIDNRLARHYRDVAGLDEDAMSLLLHSFAQEMWARKVGKARIARASAIDTIVTIDDATIAGPRLHREKMKEMRRGCDLSMAKYLEYVDTVAAFVPHKRMLHASETLRGVVMQHSKADVESSPEGMCIWLDDLIRVKIQEPMRTRLFVALKWRAEGFAAYQEAMAEAGQVVAEHRLEHSKAPSLAETLPEDLLLDTLCRLPPCTMVSLLRCCKWTGAVRQLLVSTVCSTIGLVQPGIP